PDASSSWTLKLCLPSATAWVSSVNVAPADSLHGRLEAHSYGTPVARLTSAHWPPLVSISFALVIAPSISVITRYRPAPRSVPFTVKSSAPLTGSPVSRPPGGGDVGVGLDSSRSAIW